MYQFKYIHKERRRKKGGAYSQISFNNHVQDDFLNFAPSDDHDDDNKDHYEHKDKDENENHIKGGVHSQNPLGNKYYNHDDHKTHESHVIEKRNLNMVRQT